MLNEEKPTEQAFWVALKVALYYGLFGAVWIIGTDLLVTNLPLSPGQMQRIQSIKGIIFVLLSLFVVFFLLERKANRPRRYRRNSRRNNEKDPDYLRTCPEWLTSVKMTETGQ